MFSGTANSLSSQTQGKSKQYFKDNKLSGLYQGFDPKTGKLVEEGKFQYGEETGLWKEIDADGDQIHYQYYKQRIGAICGDGTRSSATGRGACSWHGGVAEWLYGSLKNRVGGTGKHVPIETRLQQLREKVKAKLKTNKSGQELQEEILKQLLSLLDMKQSLENSGKSSVKQMQLKDDELKAAYKRLQLKQNQIKAAAKNLQLKENELKIAKNQLEKMQSDLENLQKQVKDLQSAAKQKPLAKGAEDNRKGNTSDQNKQGLQKQKEKVTELKEKGKVEKEKKKDSLPEVTSSVVKGNLASEKGERKASEQEAKQAEVKVEERQRSEDEDDPYYSEREANSQEDEDYDPAEQQGEGYSNEEEEKYANELSGSWEEDEEEEDRSAKSKQDNKGSSEAELIKQLLAKLRLT